MPLVLAPPELLVLVASVVPPPAPLVVEAAVVGPVLLEVCDPVVEPDVAPESLPPLHAAVRIADNPMTVSSFMVEPLGPVATEG
jgi:hypothetical protein